MYCCCVGLAKLCSTTRAETILLFHNQQHLFAVCAYISTAFASALLSASRVVLYSVSPVPILLNPAKPGALVLFTMNAGVLLNNTLSADAAIRNDAEAQLERAALENYVCVA